MTAQQRARRTHRHAFRGVGGELVYPPAPRRFIMSTDPDRTRRTERSTEESTPTGQALPERIPSSFVDVACPCSGQQNDDFPVRPKGDVLSAQGNPSCKPHHASESISERRDHAAARQGPRHGNGHWLRDRPGAGAAQLDLRQMKPVLTTLEANDVEIVVDTAALGTNTRRGSKGGTVATARKTTAAAAKTATRTTTSRTTKTASKGEASKSAATKDGRGRKVDNEDSDEGIAREEGGDQRRGRKGGGQPGQEDDGQEGDQGHCRQEDGRGGPGRGCTGRRDRCRRGGDRGRSRAGGGRRERARGG